MRWIRYTSKGPNQAQQVRKTLQHGGVPRVVIESGTTTLAAVDDQHAPLDGPWHRKLRHKHSKLSIQELPLDTTITYKETPCTQLILPVLLNRHRAVCKSCIRAALNGRVESAAVEEDKAVVETTEIATPVPEPEAEPEPEPEAYSLSIDDAAPGLHALTEILKARREEALKVATDIDSMVAALTGIVEATQTLEAIKTAQTASVAELALLLANRA
jgi:hypothetical protein